MRSLTRATVIAAIASGLAVATTTSAFADSTIYSQGLGAKVEWVAYGDHLYITDEIADGHSAIGVVEIGDTHYYYWNRDGKGTTRHVNLDVVENATIAVGAVLGDWQGTPTDGIIWTTLKTENVETS